MIAVSENQFIEYLRSPTSGKPLRKNGHHILTDGSEEWPYIDGIPYLRTGRDALRFSALSHVYDGDLTSALAVLLTDRRDSLIPPVVHSSAERVAATAHDIDDAMNGLGYGLMAPYVKHRWCLATFLSGLALLERHAPRGGTLFEAGCGAGHFLRRWMDRSGPAIGMDLVFSNVWLARRFVAPHAQLICCDVNDGIPLISQSADFSFAQDAFHYFPNKTTAFAEMRRIARSELVLLGHVHNATQKNFSHGDPLNLEGYVECLKPTVTYDDEKLARSALSADASTVACKTSPMTDAFAFVCGEATDQPTSSLIMPQPNVPLRLNPLLDEGKPSWPNDKFEREFVDSWDYMRLMRRPCASVVAHALSHGAAPGSAIESYARGQVFLDLPENWP